MGRYEFLSDEWMEAARAIQAEYKGRAQPPQHAIRVNQVITDVPFPPGSVQSHFDTTSGDFDLDVGWLENPDVTITLPYDVARRIYIDADPQAGMQAFMEGRLVVDGDLAKLMMFQTAPPDPLADEVQARIREITA